MKDWRDYESWCLNENILQLAYYNDSMATTITYEYEILKLTENKLKLRMTPYLELFIGDSALSTLTPNARQYHQYEFETNY